MGTVRNMVGEVADEQPREPEKPEMITVEKQHYEELLEAAKFLDALDAAGVDNWDGYDYAQDIREEWRSEGL